MLRACRVVRALPGVGARVPLLPRLRCASQLASGHDEPGARSSGVTRTDRVLRALRCHPDQIRIAAPDMANFNRYVQIPFAMINHLCLGSIFAWSIFNKPLTRLSGVVAPSAGDWLLSDIGLTFSLVMGGFVWGSVLSNRLQVWGPRACGLMGAISLGAGFGLAATAISIQSLPLLYTGGLVWGLANGLAYVPPVAMLMQWFPERKGFASGACLVGFGGGALVAAPLFSALLRHFRRAPTYLGPADSAAAVVDGAGRLFVDGREAVMAMRADLAAWPGLDEGLYAVGTGTTGAAETFAVLGATYCGAMALSALMHRLPHASFVGGAAAPGSAERALGITPFSVAPATATLTPQFALLWSCFGVSIAGSYGILSAGTTIFTDTTGASAAAAATLVAAMSASNLAGRLFWSNASDALARRHADPFRGRQLAYSLMWGAGPLLYTAVLYSVHSQPSALATGIMAASVCAIISSFGGAAATWPAICGDLWGTKHVGIIAARQLRCIGSVVLPAAYFGPKIVAWMRERGLHNALRDLAATVSDSDFLRVFGADKSALDVLIQAKTVTVARLLEIAPPGTVDPTLFIYDEMLMLMAGLQGMAFVGMRLLRPVDPKHHEKH